MCLVALADGRATGGADGGAGNIDATANSEVCSSEMVR
jgi:hypothetical protein